MKTVYFIILAIIFYLGTSAAQSVNPDSTKTSNIQMLTVTDCIKIALENNHKIKAAKYGVEIAKAQKKQAELGNTANRFKCGSDFE